LIIDASQVYAQKSSDQTANSYRIAFYNAENYFDPFVDSTSNYNEYTPDSERYWSEKRYHTKRDHIYKVIAALGGWNWPSVVGFAEIENRFILEDLIRNTPLKNANYSILHYESSDHRGIDVGMIYNKKEVRILYSRAIGLYNDKAEKLATRDILYAKILIKNDTLHLFFNHWPSRYGGMLQSEPLRILAASTLKHVTDSVCTAEGDPNILIMGDFNDDPEDESIRILTSSSNLIQLIDLQRIPDGYPVKGTLKYQSDWNAFDQVIVSGSLFYGKKSLSVKNGKAYIFSQMFLLEQDEKYLGMKPKRTYNGFKYNGGFSDHLPVYVDIGIR
jgi:predicted extracellular nuclease